VARGSGRLSDGRACGFGASAGCGRPRTTGSLRRPLASVVGSRFVSGFGCAYGSM
jgi:hypothetical protein